MSIIKKVKRAIKNTYKYIRDWSMFKRFNRALHNGHPAKIIIGASGETFFSTITQKGWLPTNESFFDITKEQHLARFFRPNTIDAMLAEHVWEHIPPELGLLAAKNCYTYLKPKGYIRVAVPDGNHPDSDYIRYVDINGIGPGAEDHKILYAYETLSKVFTDVGFTVKGLEYYDKEGKFHAIDWDPEEGMIHRSKRFDKTLINGKQNYTSLTIDAIK